MILTVVSAEIEGKERLTAIVAVGEPCVDLLIEFVAQFCFILGGVALLLDKELVVIVFVFLYHTTDDIRVALARVAVGDDGG